MKLKIAIDDSETRAVWETAQRARAEVAGWPAWKRGNSKGVKEMEEETEVVDSVLEGLTHEELKDHIIRNVKEIARLKEDGKAYAKSIREVVKELDRRNEQAVELLERGKAVSIAGNG